MTYKELVQIINSLTKEQQNQSVSINCSDQRHPVWKESEIYPLDRLSSFMGMIDWMMDTLFWRYKL